MIDSIQTVYSDALQLGAGFGRAGARMRGAADAGRQGKRHVHHPGRPRDQGRRAGRPARAGAHGRHGAVFRRRHAFELPPGARVQEPLRRGQRARRVRDDRKGPAGCRNPSALFLSQHDDAVPGSCVMVTQEGTRPLLVEIQALVDEAHAPNAAAAAVGLEQNRLAMLLAVLHRHAGIACFDQDVFVNAVGGVNITEPAADLAVLLAIVSSLATSRCRQKLVVFGEVGLAGEVRPAPRGQERLREAAKLGFIQAIVPKANKPKQAISGIEVIAVERVEEAVAQMRR